MLTCGAYSVAVHPLFQYKQNKGFCEDLTEGKFSFPIVHSIRSDTSNQRILSE